MAFFTYMDQSPIGTCYKWRVNDLIVVCILLTNTIANEENPSVIPSQN